MSTASAGTRVIVTGATGNLGTGIVRALAADPAIASVTGLARRVPTWLPERTTWVGVDLGDERTDLTGVFRGADAVIHLAWLFQPTHTPHVTWRTNVLGSLRVFDAVAAAGVPLLVHTSSVGAYSPGPKDRPVGEDWPTHGWPGAAYTREKSYLERVLDAFEQRHPGVRVVRMRPAFVFQRTAAVEQRRLFAGPLLPRALVHPELLPFVPDVPGLRFQAVHTADVADAYRLVLDRDVRGAFNLAAGPPIDAEILAGMWKARVRRVPLRLVRPALAAAWRLHAVPASPDLFDAVLRLPLMDCTRAGRELGWRPRFTAVEAVAECVEGLRDGSGGPTPPLAARTPGGRAREVGTGVGTRP
ncbi:MULTISPECIES: NAD-dependent epimerase/dehydratase family protein [Streptomyces]|uniref:NAD-dependent epimerase/dehydratase family protein n=1 Tax=Streptomyces TaxID=1883 RepID=UPI0031D85212